MSTTSTQAFERTHVARGIKAAAFVLILGSVALAADHLFFVTPQPQAAAAVPLAATPMSSPAIDGFALPDHLRHPTAGDGSGASPSF